MSRPHPNKGRPQGQSSLQTSRFLTGAVVWTFRILFIVLFRLECRGCENVKEFTQQKKPFILAINHASILDIPFIGACLGTDLGLRFNFPAKRGVLDDSRTGWFVRQLGGFPLDRETLDLAAAREILQIVRAGRCIGIAPEGTRSKTGKILPFKSGFVKLAIQTKVPIVPVAIVGGYDVLPSGAIIPRPKKVIFVYGEPMDFSSYWATRKSMTQHDYDRLAEEVRERVIDLYREHSPTGQAPVCENPTSA